MCPVFTTIRQWGDKHAAPDGPPLRLIRKDRGGSPRPYRGARGAAAERVARKRFASFRSQHNPARVFGGSPVPVSMWDMSPDWSGTSDGLGR